MSEAGSWHHVCFTHLTVLITLLTVFNIVNIMGVFAHLIILMLCLVSLFKILIILVKRTLFLLGLLRHKSLVLIEGLVLVVIINLHLFNWARLLGGGSLLKLIQFILFIILFIPVHFWSWSTLHLLDLLRCFCHVHHSVYFGLLWVVFKHDVLLRLVQFERVYLLLALFLVLRDVTLTVIVLHLLIIWLWQQLFILIILQLFLRSFIFFLLRAAIT